ncbi:DUF6287 domain-containing protein [Latilactobacillus sakei]|uniref:DUF6287 domain-containing protein n=1 Tax=Latilactobacillus sakei TaxID=1599 RepID=UPI000B9D7DC3|nr:DUF6287 domain-containing protein [Latilactobacillus sakei]MCP8851831.1 DUF6287 domain-containing protein [Latilactobacillus sakei]BAX67554.1 lipoprotein precursor [Latilactobacillus sakei]
MQKHLTVILSVIAILTLAACGQAQIKAPQTSHNKNAKVASTSHPKSASHSTTSRVAKSDSTTSQTPAKQTGMNLTQIQAGDYSNIAGQWQLSSRQAKGREMTIDNAKPLAITNNQLTSDSITLSKAGLKDNAGLHPVNFKTVNGSLAVLLADSVATNWSVTFYPIGTSTEYGLEGGSTTNSKNVIVIWTSNMSLTDVYVQS